MIADSTMWMERLYQTVFRFGPEVFDNHSRFVKGYLWLPVGARGQCDQSSGS